MTAPPDATELATPERLRQFAWGPRPHGITESDIYLSAADRIEALESRLESAEAALRWCTHCLEQRMSKERAQRKETT